MSLTEVNYKNVDFKYERQELNITGYTLYYDIENRGEQGVVIYVISDLDSIFLESSSSGPEFVFIKIELNGGYYITIGNIYRSPYSTQADDIKLCKESECLVAEEKRI